MSAEMFFWAALSFRDPAARVRLQHVLDEEGFQQGRDNILDHNLVWGESALKVMWTGAGPVRCFENAACLLELCAHHASGGEAYAIQLDAQRGYRFRASTWDGEELSAAEIRAVRQRLRSADPPSDVETSETEASRRARDKAR
ncbi:MAG: hypothetical protein HOW73_28635 [Polyangiaceae bacterium]|nr:hypothetical protein [Polyangiaceae bacterium]